MFKYSCYIENSKEAREWLKMLGYNISSIFENRFIKTTTYGKAIDYHFKNWIYSEDVIDCTNNFPLFKALTAVRDDSDYMQQFICIKSYKQDTETYSSCPGHNYKVVEKGAFFLNEFLDTMASSLYRKATKEELIERFK